MDAEPVDRVDMKSVCKWGWLKQVIAYSMSVLNLVATHNLLHDFTALQPRRDLIGCRRINHRLTSTMILEDNEDDYLMGEEQKQSHMKKEEEYINGESNGDYGGNSIIVENGGNGNNGWFGT